MRSTLALLAFLLSPTLLYAQTKQSVSFGSLGNVQIEVASSGLQISQAQKTLLRVPRTASQKILSFTVETAKLSSTENALLVRLSLPEDDEEVIVIVENNKKVALLLQESVASTDEAGRHLQLVDLDQDGIATLLRYRTDELLRHCDGESTRLGLQQYSLSEGTFVDVSVAPLLALLSPLTPGSSAPAGEQSIVWTQASSEEGKTLPSPRAFLADEDPKTAWVEGRSDAGIGELLQASLPQHTEVTGIGVQLPESAASPKTLVWSLGNGDRGSRYRLSLSGNAGTWIWFSLPKPMPARCAAVMIAEAYPGDTRLALGGIRLVTQTTAALDPKTLLKNLTSSQYETRNAAAQTLSQQAADSTLDTEIAAIVRDSKQTRAVQKTALQVLIARNAKNRAAQEAYVSQLGIHYDLALEGLLLSGEEALTTLAAQGTGEAMAKAAQVFFRKGIQSQALREALWQQLLQAEQKEPWRQALAAAEEALVDTQLQRQLESVLPNLRAEAARVLQRSPKAAAKSVAWLEVALQNETLFENQYLLLAALAASAKHSNAACETLAKTSRDSQEELLREKAVRGLAFCEDSEAMAAALQDKSPRVRSSMLKGLQEQPSIALETQLVTLLAQDPWQMIRIAALEALQDNKNQNIENVLIKQLQDTSPKVVIAIIEQIVAREQKSALTGLRGLLEDKARAAAVREEAATALGTLGGPTEGALLLSLLEENRYLAGRSEAAERLAVRCAFAVAALHSEGAYEAFEAMVLDGPGPIIQQAGVQALGQLGERRALPLLQKAIDQTNDAFLSKIAKEAKQKIEAQQ